MRFGTHQVILLVVLSRGAHLFIDNPLDDLWHTFLAMQHAHVILTHTFVCLKLVPAAANDRLRTDVTRLSQEATN